MSADFDRMNRDTRDADEITKKLRRGTVLALAAWCLVAAPAFASSHGGHHSSSSHGSSHSSHSTHGSTGHAHSTSSAKSHTSTKSTSTKGSATHVTSHPTPAPVAHRTDRCTNCDRDAHGRILRSTEAKRAFMQATGYAHGRPGYVIDHVTPLACGGADSPSNMQWQTTAAAKAKDKTERVGCR